MKSVEWLKFHCWWWVIFHLFAIFVIFVSHDHWVSSMSLFLNMFPESRSIDSVNIIFTDLHWGLFSWNILFIILLSMVSMMSVSTFIVVSMMSTVSVFTLMVLSSPLLLWLIFGHIILELISHKDSLLWLFSISSDIEGWGLSLVELSSIHSLDSILDSMIHFSIVDIEDQESQEGEELSSEHLLGLERFSFVNN